MSKSRNPIWWTREYDTAWDRIKAAVRRDWDQTKHDFGGDEPDTDQQVTDTVEQAAGTEPIPPRGAANYTYEEFEPAYRFGYGAHMHYSKQFAAWNGDLEEKLEEDWESTYPDETTAWARYRPAVRRGWEREENARRAVKHKA